MSRLLDATMAYTKKRSQFGKVLASFQVLQYRMADMLMEIESATSAVYLATLNLDAPSDLRAGATSAAKTIIGAAGKFVGQNAIQLHGGMGDDRRARRDDVEQAIVIANDTPYGLAGYIQGQDPELIAMVAARLRVGQVIIN